MVIRFISVAIAVAMLFLVASVAPDQLGVTIAKLSLVTLGAIAGFYIDSALFPYANPDEFKKLADGEPDEDIRVAYMDSQDTAAIRRAVIVAAAIIGVCLGL